MSEWISVKEELPKEKELAETLTFDNRQIRKLYLVDTSDSMMREEGVYEWKYKSGILAAFLHPDDQWRRDV